MNVEPNKAVFIDRDGTLNEMVFDENHGVLDSPFRPEQVKLKKHAADFLKGLEELGYARIIVTNQPGVAKGTMTLDDLSAVNARILELLEKEGGDWDDLYVSPYHPDGGAFPVASFVKKTDCRKPAPGMLLQAAEQHNIDLVQSWMIGDGLTDVQAGRAAGCKTILMAKPKVDIIEKFLSLDDAVPDYFVKDLAEALSVIRDAR